MNKKMTIPSQWLVCICIFAAGFILQTSVGCNKKTASVSSNADEAVDSAGNAVSTRAGVATIDVNRIASDCGALAEINKELDKREAEFNLVLDGLRKIHLDDLAKREKEFGNSPTEEQQKELAALRKQQATEYNIKWQDTRIKLSTMKTKLDEAFLTRLKPLAQSVATEKGLSVVIRTENVFCQVDQYDITEDVSKEFQKKFPPKTETPVVEVAEKIPSRGGEFVPRK